MSARGRTRRAVVTSMVLLAGVLAGSSVGSAEPTSGGGPGGTVSATVLVNPLEIELTLTSRSVRTGQRVRASATVSNLGTNPLDEVVVRLHASGTLVIIDQEEQDVGTVEAGSQVRLTWWVCSNEPVSQLLLVSADAILDANPLRAESEAHVLTVTSGGRGSGPSCP
jgi:hypothetical protein